MLTDVDDVSIDEGTCKYILIEVFETKDPKNIKTILRSYNWAHFHDEIFQSVSASLEPLGISCQCVGGGRIKHDPATKTIEVYGYSQGYGPADHKYSVGLLKKYYSDYSIKITDEEY